MQLTCNNAKLLDSDLTREVGMATSGGSCGKSLLKLPCFAGEAKLACCCSCLIGGKREALEWGEGQAFWVALWTNNIGGKSLAANRMLLPLLPLAFPPKAQRFHFSAGAPLSRSRMTLITSLVQGK